MEETKQSEIPEYTPEPTEVKSAVVQPVTEEEKQEELDKRKEPVPEDNETVVEKVNTMLSAAERLEKANKRTEELIVRAEEIAARGILGGQLDAGSVPKTDDEKTTEQAEEIVKGFL